jgi:hypothetical protein
MKLNLKYTIFTIAILTTTLPSYANLADLDFQNEIEIIKTLKDDISPTHINLLTARSQIIETIIAERALYTKSKTHFEENQKIVESIKLNIDRLENEIQIETTNNNDETNVVLNEKKQELLNEQIKLKRTEEESGLDSLNLHRDNLDILLSKKDKYDGMLSKYTNIEKNMLHKIYKEHQEGEVLNGGRYAMKVIIPVAVKILVGIAAWRFSSTILGSIGSFLSDTTGITFFNNWLNPSPSTD